MTSHARRQGRPLPKDYRDRRHRPEVWPRVEAKPKVPKVSGGDLESAPGWVVRVPATSAAALLVDLHPIRGRSSSLLTACCRRSNRLRMPQLRDGGRLQRGEAPSAGAGLGAADQVGCPIVT